ncbi:MAG TPA: ABC transporter ATP-binding protein [Thermoanaerobaculia bacterium]|nr:ABC transporter ATP-binding protein [Thermoanaerobaculia bacterium]
MQTYAVQTDTVKTADAVQADAVLRAHRLGKTYRLYASPWDRVIERITGRPRHREHVALADVDFTVGRGEGFGVIGQNGAGKSTLLKLLAGVLEPTRGEVEVRGTISSILELGAGFHPEFTGRQNIRINAAMLGLDARTVDAKGPAIEEFCELGEFLDRAVKTYSTGMVMRLAFAIATQVDPEVLIVDEALSVGDGYFQKKCSDRILALLEQGTTLLFCSHAMYYVDTFCRQAIWLRDGRIAARGAAVDVIREYEDFLARASAQRQGAAGEPDHQWPEVAPAGGSPARLVAVEVLPAEGELRSGERLAVEVEWTTGDPALAFHVGVGINRSDGVEVITLSTADLGLEPLRGAERYRGRFVVPDLPLVKGDFHIYVFLLDERAVHVYDRRVLERSLQVREERYRFGLVRVGYRWEAGAAPALPAAAGDARRGTP